MRKSAVGSHTESYCNESLRMHRYTVVCLNETIIQLTITHFRKLISVSQGTRVSKPPCCHPEHCYLKMKRAIHAVNKCLHCCVATHLSHNKDQSYPVAPLQPDTLPQQRTLYYHQKGNYSLLIDITLLVNRKQEAVVLLFLSV